MKKLVMLSFANIKKAKGQSISLLTFILIATMLLSLGLMLYFNFGSFFDKKAAELDVAHYSVVEERRIYDEEQTSFLKNYKGVEKTEKEDVLSFMTDIVYNEGEMPGVTILAKEGNSKGMGEINLIEGKESLSERGIYLPYIFKTGGGYEVGDEFRLKVGEESRKYTVDGFTEEILFGSANNQLFRFYISDKDFNELAVKYPSFDCVLQSVQMKDDPMESATLNSAFIKKFFYDNTVEDSSVKYLYYLDYSAVKNARTFLANIMAMIMVAFAAMIVVISLIVVRFRIKNSIEENMTNIGALKAVGYTGRQMLISYLFQFVGLSLLGVILGIGATYAILPAISRMMQAQTALVWKQGFDPILTVITFAVIMLAIILVTLISARGIVKKEPLMALRSELNHSHYSKNHFPIAKTRGSLTSILAVKSIMQSKGQSIMITIIIAIASFIAISGIAMYTNVGMNSKDFTETIAGEMPDAAFMVKNSEDAPRLMKKFKESDDVRKAFYSQGIHLLLDDNETMSTITENFDDYEGSYLYKGSYPKASDEIAISSLLMNLTDKTIGDKVTIEQGEKVAEYKITGLLQTMNDGGRLVALTDAGVKQVIPDYKPLYIYLYLEKPEETAKFIKNVETEEGDIFYNVLNMQELAETQLGAFNSVFFILAVVIIAVTLFIIFLVLYLVLKTMILRKSKALGIQKALGFSSWNLVNQMALNLFPMILVGVILGSIAGYFGFNPLIDALMGTMGIMNTPMDITLPITLVVCACLILVSWLLSIAIAMRVRKISPIILMGE